MAASQKAAGDPIRPFRIRRLTYSVPAATTALLEMLFSPARRQAVGPGSDED
jgi:hypothetical protein